MAKMSYNNFRESRLQFSDSLNGQHWIFLRKGLDDFRGGFPPSSENMIVYGKKRPIILKSSTVKSSHTAPRNKSKKSSKIQLSEELTGIFSPNILFNSKADCERENQTLQEVQDHMEDKQMKVTNCKILARSKESRGKKTSTSLSKKKVAAREKEATQGNTAPLNKYVKQVTKHFCDWVMSLGGGNWNIDEDTLRSLLSTSREREATLPTPFCAVKLDVQPKQSKSQEATPPKIAVRSSHQLGCHVKEMEVAQLYSTQAFKEFLERKGYRKPQFLLKMLVGRNDNGAQEEMFKACKK
ncbi:uncharacterized protein LOC422643 isoform X1 [Gallus gallus]|uniref:uncharacterized protein LOC422643 isoform X1 n=1 Tax=Gallus gallus TaxID=9031 RepID=UPI001AEAA870|nr:uncharacterized protein LOC422643 isoform X1 [Gallus gallus]XP_040526838.1 uncharacterized protein LOC422643 isoform X1 [Gallus gallus]